MALGNIIPALDYLPGLLREREMSILFKTLILCFLSFCQMLTNISSPYINSNNNNKKENNGSSSEH